MHYGRTFLILASAFLIGLSMGPAMAEDAGFSLKAVGDEVNGYGVVLLYDGREVARHNGGGEFTLILQNAQFDNEWAIKDWKATSQRGDNSRIELSGRLELPVPGTVIEVDVLYEVINKHVVKKRMKLKNHQGPQLFYRIENRLEPLSAPESYWTFEQENDVNGGTFYEVYPAVGFRTDDLSIGLLTANGAKNLWNRTRLQWNWLDSTPLPIRRITDMDLVSSASPAEREAGEHYVSLNFGCLDIFNPQIGQEVVFADADKWIGRGGVSIDNVTSGGLSMAELTVGPKGDETQCADFPVQVSKNECYQISFEYKSNSPIGVRIWDHEKKEIFSPRQYPRLDASPGQWQSFQQEFLIWNALGDPEPAWLSLEFHEPDGAGRIRNLRIKHIEPERQAYHPLDMGTPSEKTIFVFAEPRRGHREEMIASQTRLAEGYGFEGTMADKIFFATAQMLIWNTSSRKFTPQVVPSCNYQPNMFMRDAYWIITSIFDQEVSESVWNQYAERMNRDGAIPTITTAHRDTFPATYAENDSILFFILLAYVNHTRYGTPVDKPKLELALEYIRKAYDPERQGKYASATPGWFDTIWYPEKAIFASNQGIFVNVLRCAQAMDLDVTDKEIEGAREAYRALFDPDRGYLVFADVMPHLMSPSTLIGEFMSYWLWNEPILDDAMVIETLEHLPLMSNGCVPCLVTDNGNFLDIADPEVSKFVPESLHPIFWKGGIYHNGGSWLLYEYLAYVAGLKHGWEPAKERMERRLNAEFNDAPNEPVSHEWIPLPKGESPGHERWPLRDVGVYGWNSFVIIANEVAGLRSPGQSDGRPEQGN